MSGWREQASTTALYLEGGKKARRTDEDGEQLLMLAKGGALQAGCLQHFKGVIQKSGIFCQVCLEVPFFSFT